MKRQLLAAGMFAALSYASLLAGDATLWADIPFDFVISQTALPAGQYTIAISNGMLVMSTVDGKHTAVTLTSPIATSGFGREEKHKGHLRFRQYGNESFLSGVWTGNGPEGYTVPESARQKELARYMKPAEATAVAFGRQ